MGPEKAIEIGFTPNGKWFHIDGIEGWVRTDIISRVSVNKHGESIIYVTLWYTDGGGQDYFTVRVKDVHNGQALVSKLMEKVGI